MGILNPSEAVCGFAAWLTTSKRPTIFSSAHDSGIIADLVSKFCKANDFEPVRDDFIQKWEKPDCPELEQTDQMNFVEAAVCMRNGSKVYRKGWLSNSRYVSIINAKIKEPNEDKPKNVMAYYFFDEANKPIQVYIPNPRDLFAEDWTILDD